MSSFYYRFFYTFSKVSKLTCEYCGLLQLEIPSEPPELPELADPISSVCSDPPTAPSVIVLVLPKSCSNLFPMMCVCDISNVKSKMRPK